MTLRLVPGGPEPMTKGFGSLSPSTVVASVGMCFRPRGGISPRKRSFPSSNCTSVGPPGGHNEFDARPEADGCGTEGPEETYIRRERRAARRVHQDVVRGPLL